MKSFSHISNRRDVGNFCNDSLGIHITDCKEDIFYYTDTIVNRMYADFSKMIIKYDESEFLKEYLKIIDINKKVDTASEKMKLIIMCLWHQKETGKPVSADSKIDIIFQCNLKNFSGYERKIIEQYEALYNELKNEKIDNAVFRRLLMAQDKQEIQGHINLGETRVSANDLIEPEEVNFYYNPCYSLLGDFEYKEDSIETDYLEKEEQYALKRKLYISKRDLEAELKLALDYKKSDHISEIIGELHGNDLYEKYLTCKYPEFLSYLSLCKGIEKSKRDVEIDRTSMSEAQKIKYDFLEQHDLNRMPDFFNEFIFKDLSLQNSEMFYKILELDLASILSFKGENKEQKEKLFGLIKVPPNKEASILHIDLCKKFEVEYSEQEELVYEAEPNENSLLFNVSELLKKKSENVNTDVLLSKIKSAPHLFRLMFGLQKFTNDFENLASKVYKLLNEPNHVGYLTSKYIEISEENRDQVSTCLGSIQQLDAYENLQKIFKDISENKFDNPKNVITISEYEAIKEKSCEMIDFIKEDDKNNELLWFLSFSDYFSDVIDKYEKLLGDINKRKDKKLAVLMGNAQLGKTTTAIRIAGGSTDDRRIGDRFNSETIFLDLIDSEDILFLDGPGENDTRSNSRIVLELKLARAIRSDRAITSQTDCIIKFVDSGTIYKDDKHLQQMAERIFHDEGNLKISEFYSKHLPLLIGSMNNVSIANEKVIEKDESSLIKNALRLVSKIRKNEKLFTIGEGFENTVNIQCLEQKIKGTEDLKRVEIHESELKELGIKDKQQLVDALSDVFHDLFKPTENELTTRKTDDLDMISDMILSRVWKFKELFKQMTKILDLKTKINQRIHDYTKVKEVSPEILDEDLKYTVKMPFYTWDEEKIKELKKKLKDSNLTDYKKFFEFNKDSRRTNLKYLPMNENLKREFEENQVVIKFLVEEKLTLAKEYAQVIDRVHCNGVNNNEQYDFIQGSDGYKLMPTKCREIKEVSKTMLDKVASITKFITHRFVAWISFRKFVRDSAHKEHRFYFQDHGKITLVFLSCFGGKILDYEYFEEEERIYMPYLFLNTAERKEINKENTGRKQILTHKDMKQLQLKLTDGQKCKINGGFDNSEWKKGGKLNLIRIFMHTFCEIIKQMQSPNPTDNAKKLFKNRFLKLQFDNCTEHENLDKKRYMVVEYISLYKKYHEKIKDLESKKYHEQSKGIEAKDERQVNIELQHHKKEIEIYYSLFREKLFQAKKMVEFLLKYNVINTDKENLEYLLKLFDSDDLSQTNNEPSVTKTITNVVIHKPKKAAPIVSNLDLSSFDSRIYDEEDKGYESAEKEFKGNPDDENKVPNFDLSRFESRISGEEDIGYESAKKEFKRFKRNPDDESIGPNSTLLSYAIVSRQNKMLKLLLELKADPCFHYHRGEQPIHKAVLHGNAYAVAKLLEFKADANANVISNGKCWTPCSIAKYYGLEELTQLLTAKKDNIVLISPEPQSEEKPVKHEAISIDESLVGELYKKLCYKINSAPDVNGLKEKLDAKAANQSWLSKAQHDKLIDSGHIDLLSPGPKKGSVKVDSNCTRFENDKKERMLIALKIQEKDVAFLNKIFEEEDYYLAKIFLDHVGELNSSKGLNELDLSKCENNDIIERFAKEVPGIFKRHISGAVKHKNDLLLDKLIEYNYFTVDNILNVYDKEGNNAFEYIFRRQASQKAKDKFEEISKFKLSNATPGKLLDEQLKDLLDLMKSDDNLLEFQRKFLELFEEKESKISELFKQKFPISGMNLQMICAKTGGYNKFRFIVNKIGCDYEERSKNGFSVFMYSMMNPSKDILKKFLEFKNRITFMRHRSKRNDTPLHIAAFLGLEKELFTKILKILPDIINDVNIFGFTAKRIAEQENQSEILSVLEKESAWDRPIYKGICADSLSYYQFGLASVGYKEKLVLTKEIKLPYNEVNEIKDLISRNIGKYEGREKKILESVSDRMSTRPWIYKEDFTEGQKSEIEKIENFETPMKKLKFNFEVGTFIFFRESHFSVIKVTDEKIKLFDSLNTNHYLYDEANRTNKKVEIVGRKEQITNDCAGRSILFACNDIADVDDNNARATLIPAIRDLYKDTSILPEYERKEFKDQVEKEVKENAINSDVKTTKEFFKNELCMLDISIVKGILKHKHKEDNSIGEVLMLCYDDENKEVIYFDKKQKNERLLAESTWDQVKELSFISQISGFVETYCFSHEEIDIIGRMMESAEYKGFCEKTREYFQAEESKSDTANCFG